MNLSIALTAARRGASVANHTEVIRLLKKKVIEGNTDVATKAFLLLFKDVWIENKYLSLRKISYLKGFTPCPQMTLKKKSCVARVFVINSRKKNGTSTQTV